MNFSRKSLLLILPFLLISAVASDAIPVRSSVKGDEELICHDNTPCYPRLFTPTNDFQVIRKDQDLPPGLHVRLNLETGAKEAKFYNPDEDTGSSNNLVVVDPSSHSDELSPSPSPPHNDAPVKPPKSAPSDRGTFDNAVVVLSDKSSSAVATLFALTSLEDLAHEIYWGEQLAAPSPVQRLLDLAASANPNIRASAALVLGSACSNNPKALSKTIENVGGAGKLLLPLLEAVGKETDAKARQRLIFAIAQMLKDDSVRRELLSSDGVEILNAVFRNHENSRGKIAVLVEDTFLNEDMREENGRARAIKGEGRLKGLCPAFAEAVVEMEKSDEDAAAKVMSALVALNGKFGGGCKHGEEFERWIGRVKEDDGEGLGGMVAENRRKFMKVKEL
jgi:nucleotide exchange factor SIL1